METQRTQIKIAMNYGALYGLSSVAVFLIFYFVGTDIQSRLPQWIGYMLLVVFIIMGVKSYRDEDLGGVISYGKSLGTGMLISIFGGVITAIFSILFFTYLAPEMGQQILESAQKNMVESGMPDEQIEAAMTMTAKLMTPFWLFFLSVIGSALMGLIFSLLISVFLKKEANPFNSNIG